MLFHLSAHLHFLVFFLSQALFVTSLFTLSQEIGMSHAGVTHEGKNVLKLHIDFGFKELKIFAKLRGEKCWVWHKLGYLVLTAMDFQCKLSCAPATLSLSAFAPSWEKLLVLQTLIVPVPCSSSSSQETQILQELLHCPNIIKDEYSRKFVFHCFLGSAQCTLSV